MICQEKLVMTTLQNSVFPLHMSCFFSLFPVTGEMSKLDYQEDDPLLVPTDPEFRDPEGRQDDKPININSIDSYVSTHLPGLLSFDRRTFLLYNCRCRSRQCFLSKSFQTGLWKVCNFFSKICSWFGLTMIVFI